MLQHLRTSLATLAGDRKGVTAMEYGLIAAFTAVAIVAGLIIIGPRLSAIFLNVANSLPTV